MNEPAKPKNAAQKNAQNYFTTVERNETASKQIRKKERSAEAVKTAKLRELRLAKEAVDKEAADKLAAETAALPPSETARRKRAPAVKAAPRVRMIY